MENLSNDKNSTDLIKSIFPQLINIGIFKKLNSIAKSKLNELDFIFILSLLIIDKTDNFEFFIYKFNLSKKDQKRLKIINDFYKSELRDKSFSEQNLNKLFYYEGEQAVNDIINFKLFISKKIDNRLVNLLETYKSKTIPIMPVSANKLISEFNIPEGKTLGNKLKIIESKWVENNFKLSEKEINKIISG